MDFKYKTAEEIGKMSAEEQNKYLADKTAHEKEVRKEEIEKAVKPVKDDVATIKTSQEESAKDVSAIKEDLSSLNEKIKTINIPGLSDDTLAKALQDNAEEIQKVFAKGSGVIELKAVADITTANGTNTAPPAIIGTQLSPLQNVNLRTFDIEQLCNVLLTSQAAYSYTETVPKDGDYAFVAEGALKPQTDFKWETNYAKPKKIAAWMHLTEESVADVKGLEGVAKDYLKKKHDIFKAKGLLFGDGTGENPKGATKYGRTFVAGAMAAKVEKPNFMDVVNAAITDIATTHNYQDETPYMANLVLVNPVDFFLYVVSAKDANGLPLYPTASLFNMLVIGGLVIKPEETIPAGKIFVGDLDKYNITNYLPYTVKIGWINDDFIKNMFVILGESRFHAFVKKLDQQAFIYDDFATIKTAITKP